MKTVSLAFAGQGAQFPQMGLDLYNSSKAAREIFQQADEILGRKITSLCFEAPMEDLTSCANCQPAIFTMSAACFAALQEALPFQPVACAGLSLGELTAMYAAGCCDFATGLRLVQARGRLMDEACQSTSGAMLAVLGASMETLEDLCAKFDIDIANLNCPGQVILSGATEKIDALQASPDAASIKAVRLNVAGAYHSRVMSKASEEFATVLADASLTAPACKFAQNFTGTYVSDLSDLKANLVSQIAHTVHCEDCLRLLAADSDVILELGPGNVLAGLMKRIDRQHAMVSVSSTDSIKKAMEVING